MRRTLAILAALAAAALGAAAPASASLQVDTFTASASTDLAGAHPDATTFFQFKNIPNSQPARVDGTMSKVVIDLPPGLIGNPQAVPHCSQAVFSTEKTGFPPQCPLASQVGQAQFVVQGVSGQGALNGGNPLPVYNLDAGPDSPGLLGIPLPFGVGNAYVHITTRTTNDYGLTTAIINVPKVTPVVSSTLTLWGVPADHNNSGAPRVPFMTNPTSCTPLPPPSIAVPQLTAFSYETGDTPVGPVQSDPLPNPITGCDTLAFDPSIDVSTDNPTADAPAGYTVTLNVPQNNDPDGRATSQLHGASVTLPLGTSISPAAADGLRGCTDPQLGLGSDAPATCPDASKVGTVSFDVPLLAVPLSGDIFLAAPIPGHPYRVFLVAQGSGLVVKLIGDVTPDPVTGQLTTSFPDNPQVPFSKFTLTFKGGPRAMLANANACGPQTTTSSLTPWSGGLAATPSSAFTLTGCNQPFTPTFAAGTTSTQAGGDTGFVLDIGRGDAQPELGSLSVSMPPGLLGKLAGRPICPQSAAVAGACDPSTQVGTADVASGSGLQPLVLRDQPVYLAAPEHPGDVASLAIVNHAIAGPFDLGTAVVQSAIRLRQSDGGLDIVSDPLPTILGGIPLRLRSIVVTVNAPGFLTNPTNCNPLAVKGSVTSVAGQTVSEPDVPFQATGCSALPLRPTLHARIGAPRQDGTKAHPPFTTIISQPAGDANLRSTSVTLPPQVSISLPAIQHPCTNAQLAADACPAVSQIGQASATTPVLDAPLSGPVYLVEALTGGLPDVVARLRGQLGLDLRGQVAPDARGRLVTTFGAIPDVPISRFQLTLTGGKAGSLLNLTNLCTSKPSARVTFVGQNGKRVDRTVRVPVDGCPAASKSHKHKKHHKHHKRRKHKKAKAKKSRAAAWVATSGERIAHAPQ